MDGLRNPLGDNGELATHYLLTCFESEEDRRWGRKLLARVADLAVVTTAMIVILIPVTPILLGNATEGGPAKAEYWAQVSETSRIWRDARFRIANSTYEAMNHVTPDGLARLQNLMAISSRKDALEDYFDRRNAGEHLRPLGREEAAAARRAAGERLERMKEVYSTFSRADIRKDLLGDRGEVWSWLRDSFDDAKNSAAQIRTAAARLELAADRLAQENIRNAVFASATVGATLPMLLLLYVGYFMSLRNGLKAIVEAIALRMERDTGDKSSHRCNRSALR